MPIDRSTPGFFDATCLVAAAGSPTGGSGYLFSLCERGFFVGAVSHLVLREAARNVRDKLTPAALRHFDRLRNEIPLQIVTISEADQQQYVELVNEKDIHVLAGAVLVSAPYLITLDRRFAAEVNRINLPVQALTPAAFIQSNLVDHPDYREMRI